MKQGYEYEGFVPTKHEGAPRDRENRLLAAQLVEIKAQLHSYKAYLYVIALSKGFKQHHLKERAARTALKEKDKGVALTRLRLMQVKHGQLWCRDASAQGAARFSYGVLLQDMKKQKTCDGDAEGEEWYLQYNNQSRC